MPRHLELGRYHYAKTVFRAPGHMLLLREEKKKVRETGVGKKMAMQVTPQELIGEKKKKKVP